MDREDKEFDEFKIRLSQIMTQKGFDRVKLATAMGRDKNTIDNIWKKDRKKFPYADDLYLMARALGVSMEFLTTGKEERSSVADPDIRQIISELELLKQMDSYQVESMAEQIHALMLLKVGNSGNNVVQKGEQTAKSSA